ncbi:hypothetical protein L3D_01230 [Enterococcus faecalis]|nr:hypothetical protein L3D_01230 [Enterococcus faecalis]
MTILIAGIKTKGKIALAQPDEASDVINTLIALVDIYNKDILTEYL